MTTRQSLTVDQKQKVTAEHQRQSDENEDFSQSAFEF